MNPGAPVLQAAGGEGALLGAHFQVGQKQLCGVSGPEVGVSKVARGGTWQAAVECTHDQAATHGEYTAEPSLGDHHHPSQGLAQYTRKEGTGFSPKPSGAIHLGKETPRNGQHRAEGSDM